MTIDEFQKAELRAGKVLSAERVEGSDKLLKLSVDLGEKNEDGSGKPRQILAGIGKAYEPDALIGKEFIFVTNLESRILMGMESQGRILAAHDENDLPVLVSPEKQVELATKLS